MAVVRWSPLTELASLQSDMARMMDGVFGGRPANGGTSAWLPAVDVTETEDSLVLSFDLPGVNENEIEATYANGVLEIKVPKPEEHKPRKIQIGTGERAIEGSGTRKDK